MLFLILGAGKTEGGRRPTGVLPAPRIFLWLSPPSGHSIILRARQPSIASLIPTGNLAD